MDFPCSFSGGSFFLSWPAPEEEEKVYIHPRGERHGQQTACMHVTDSWW